MQQVYKGRLKDGSPVAVKVQRPHVVETVSVDLYIIRYTSRQGGRDSCKHAAVQATQVMGVHVSPASCISW